MTPLYEVPRAAQFTDRRLGEGKHEGLVFNGDRAAVREDENSSGDGGWWWQHNNVNANVQLLPLNSPLKNG